MPITMSPSSGRSSRRIPWSSPSTPPVLTHRCLMGGLPLAPHYVTMSKNRRGDRRACREMVLVFMIGLSVYLFRSWLVFGLRRTISISRIWPSICQDLCRRRVLPPGAAGNRRVGVTSARAGGAGLMGCWRRHLETRFGHCIGIGLQPVSMRCTDT